MNGLGVEWIFIRGKDSVGHDILRAPNNNLNNLVSIAEEHKACAFNTLGFVKEKVVFPLETSNYYSASDGIFIHASAFPHNNIISYPESDQISLEELEDYKL